MTPRMLERYRSDATPKLKEEFGYTNPHQVPCFDKIVVNIGLGEATQNPKLLERATEELALITGQKAMVRRARKSVANFKLREGQAIGCMATLRGIRMWEFYDRLVHLILTGVTGCDAVAIVKPADKRQEGMELLHWDRRRETFGRCPASPKRPAPRRSPRGKRRHRLGR